MCLFRMCSPIPPSLSPLTFPSVKSHRLFLPHAVLTICSAYFQQIEADVVKHADAIWQAKAELEAFQTTNFEELVTFRDRIESLLQDLTDETQDSEQAKAELEAFQTTDFDELVVFRARIESLFQDLTDETQTTDFDELVAFRAKIEALLQDLTDETQVLQRFEGFPSSKLELLRASASLHSRLSALSHDLLSAVLQRFEGFPSSKLELLRASASLLQPRFDGFPSSKLELLRASASLHSRLSALSHDLLSAVPMSNNDRGGTPGAAAGNVGTAGAVGGAGGAGAAAAPASVAAVGVCLDRCERLFDRVRREVEAVERSREEDAKKFAAQRLPYSGGAIERVKAAAVRLSSRLLELSAQESMKLRASVELVDGRIPVYDVPRVKAGLFLLWRCFQFAFRAYNFAGGQDETAEELALTVAKEMEAYPAYMWG
ncbi:unnamed protein product [Closterium sp. Yama58-4]|nr:unnamed protein product [Closterium sp. Yama58-4]